jgi:hypothetical protein
MGGGESGIIRRNDGKEYRKGGEAFTWSMADNIQSSNLATPVLLERWWEFLPNEYRWLGCCR